MLIMLALCPSVEPGSWVSVPVEQPVVEATEVIKEAGFQIDDARHRVYFASRGEYCLLYTSPSPRDLSTSRMPSSA